MPYESYDALVSLMDSMDKFYNEVRVDVVLSDTRIILGDMENAVCINSIILLTKKVIYNAMKKEQKPHVAQVKNDVKKFYFEEKYRHYIQGKGCLSDKQYILLNNIH